MQRLLVSATSLAACLALVFTAGAVHAQSSAFLYVGADETGLNTGYGTATVSASGTSASGLYAFIAGADSSTTDYKGLSAFGTGQITVTGGTFQQLTAEDSGVINLIGDNFAQSGSYFIDDYGTPWYTISGTLQESTTPFTAELYAPGTGSLEFNGIQAVPGGSPVPEASTTVSLGLLLLGTAWLAVKRRKASV